jgi:murein DD-endopeptidase MepM/ murein hydrolase activator NlpD
LGQPPVRFYAAAIGLVSLTVFAGALGYGRAQAIRRHEVRSHRAGAAVQTPSSRTGGRSASGPTANIQSPAGGTSLRPGNGRTAALSRTADPVRRHRVEQGDTLWELATRYGVTIEELLAVNGPLDPGHLRIGQELVLPARAGDGTATASAAAEEALQGAFAWPVLAPISSPFGPRWGRNHAGIDLAANMGAPIRAARDGQVLLAGPVSGYGQTVVIRHVDGTRTLYAHCSRLNVAAGQQVKQGQVIALVGSTGVSTGPHLHFEIIVNNRPRDPLRYLPRR